MNLYGQRDFIQVLGYWRRTERIYFKQYRINIIDKIWRECICVNKRSFLKPVGKFSYFYGRLLRIWSWVNELTTSWFSESLSQKTISEFQFMGNQEVTGCKLHSNMNRPIKPWTLLRSLALPVNMETPKGTFKLKINTLF